jgi:hypothetical protein
MNNKYTTTTEHILALHTDGVSSYDIVSIIVDDWDMSSMRASVMVDYVLKDILYKEEDKDES